MWTELKPEYDSRKSFYGKALVYVGSDKKVLHSYSTNVAMIKDGEFYCNGLYSATTSRHIREFAYQNGFPTDRKFLDSRIKVTVDNRVSIDCF